VVSLGIGLVTAKNLLVEDALLLLVDHPARGLVPDLLVAEAAEAQALEEEETDQGPEIDLETSPEIDPETGPERSRKIDRVRGTSHLNVAANVRGLLRGRKKESALVLLRPRRSERGQSLLRLDRKRSKNNVEPRVRKMEVMKVAASLLLMRMLLIKLLLDVLFLP